MCVCLANTWEGELLRELASPVLRVLSPNASYEDQFGKEHAVGEECTNAYAPHTGQEVYHLRGVYSLLAEARDEKNDLLEDMSACMPLPHVVGEGTFSRRIILPHRPTTTDQVPLTADRNKERGEEALSSSK